VCTYKKSNTTFACAARGVDFVPAARRKWIFPQISIRQQQREPKKREKDSMTRVAPRPHIHYID
jgi:hypothetical protein